MKKLLGILVLGLLLSSNAYAYDSTKYAICYGEMTNAHKARGLHKSNRALSIKIKETVCKSYANKSCKKLNLEDLGYSCSDLESQTISRIDKIK